MSDTSSNPINARDADNEAPADCSRLRIVYAGTPDFAVPALQQLIDSDHQVLAVYTQPDRPSGRGRKLQHGPVKTCALEQGIEVRQPPSLRDTAAQEELAALKPDVIVVAAYGLILPPAVLQLPPLGCINIHASLLPRWRGAAPLQRSILAGDKITGITLMLMDEGLDTGDMIETSEQVLNNDMTCAELHDYLAQAGAETLLRTLSGWCEGSMQATPQPQDGTACYAAKLEKSEAQIDWTLGAAEIQRQVMAFNPWPVAQTDCDGITLRLWRSRVVSQAEVIEFLGDEQGGGAANYSATTVESTPPGTVVRAKADQFWVQTGCGVLALLSVQAPGKKPLPSKDFLNSRDLQGAVLTNTLSPQSGAQRQSTTQNVSVETTASAGLKKRPDGSGSRNE